MWPIILVFCIALLEDLMHVLLLKKETSLFQQTLMQVNQIVDAMVKILFILIGKEIII